MPQDYHDRQNCTKKRKVQGGHNEGRAEYSIPYYAAADSDRGIGEVTKLWLRYTALILHEVLFLEYTPICRVYPLPWTAS